MNALSFAPQVPSRSPSLALSPPTIPAAAFHPTPAAPRPSRFPPRPTTVMSSPFDRETPSVGANATMPSATNGAVGCSLLIRKLPLKTTKDTLRSMVVWSKEFLDADVLPAERSQDAGFSAAVLHFKTPAGAQEAKSMLDGKPNIANDATMIVEVFYGSPITSRRFPSEPASNAGGSSSSSTTSSTGPTPRQPSRFESSFQSLGRLSPPNSASGYASKELPNPESTSIYQNLFSPQSPIGNHLNERTRISGKSLINNDTQDDETGELLKDPVAYAENGSAMAVPRRSTMPQLPISRLANLSLNTNTVGVPTSLSSYIPQQSLSMQHSHMSAISPTALSNGGTPSMNYQMGPQPYSRHNFPPVNPADQNPPCNTLYVGNLPIDTSEDELKAMFSKQRGYKRLCFRTKQNGPMCFVEFEDVSFATKALHELYGHPLHNSVKGGIRLSFSKNPLGVRSGQQTAAPGNVPGTVAMQSMGAMMNSGPGTSFTTASGPPPGLSAPPGLGQNRLPYSNPAHHLNGNPAYHGGFNGTANGWNSPPYTTMTPSAPASMMSQSSGFPSSYMMGR